MYVLILEGNEITQQFARHFQDDLFRDSKMVVPANMATLWFIKYTYLERVCNICNILNDTTHVNISNGH